MFGKTISVQELKKDHLSVDEAMRFLCEQIDYFGVALIEREYEPGSSVVRELVAMARACLLWANEKKA